MNTGVIRVLVIDDHEIFCAGLSLLLEQEPGINVVAEARNKNEALEAARSRPDVILLDLDLGSDSGLELVPELMKAAPQARILVLTGVLDPSVHLRAVCLGAIGVVLKLEAARILTKAIRKVHAGEAWLNRTMVANAMSELQTKERKDRDPEQSKIASLTARESEIIALIGEGLRNKAIAARLYISEKTVRHHLTSIFNKLEVSDRLELIIYAFEHDLAKVRGKTATR